MSRSETSKFAILAVVCLLGIGPTGSAHAQHYAVEWSDGSIINLTPGSNYSSATAINSVGEVVGWTFGTEGSYAFEWNGGSVINLGGGAAYSINDSGQVVGYSYAVDFPYAVEWSGGSVIELGGLPGSEGSVPYSINEFGQVVGYSYAGGFTYATEWSGGKVIDLGPGGAYAINNVGQVLVGYGVWSNGGVTDLGSLPGSTGFEAVAINDSGQVVGWSIVGDYSYATEWIDGVPHSLGNLPGSPDCEAYGINDVGQVVGSCDVGSFSHAVEWSSGKVTYLGGLGGINGSIGDSVAYAINDAGQIVGQAEPGVPEPSTWALMLLGFAGLGWAGYRRARTGHARLAT